MHQIYPMNCEIVKATTQDNLTLYGLLFRAKGSAIVINIHGTASNFYEEDFIPVIAKKFGKAGISMLSTNNRGANVLQAYPPSGASMELFENCILDIDAWISFAKSMGYTDIILEGHSFGTEKVVYYMNKGKHRKSVKAVILLGFSDSWGSQAEYAKNKKYLMDEAKGLVEEGKGHLFLRSDWHAQYGIMSKSAASYLNCYADNSELSKALPLNTGKLDFYRKIKVPILAVIGDKKEYTVIPVKDALELLKKENRLTKAYQIKNCNHCFEGKEKELAGIVEKFLIRV